MYTKSELEKIINKNANTKVSMRGEVDSSGVYKGHLEGSSVDELYAFVSYIANVRGKAFEQVDFRYGNPNPPTFTCYISFDTKDLGVNKKRGFFNRLFS